MEHNYGELNMLQCVRELNSTIAWLLYCSYKEAVVHFACPISCTYLFFEERVSPQSYDLKHIMQTYYLTSLKLNVTINITINGSFKELESFKLLVYTCNVELLHYIALASWYYCHNNKHINYTHSSWWNYGRQLVIWIRCTMTMNWQESRY